MRVAIVSPPIQISGGMKEKLLLGRALAASGIKVDIVTDGPERLSAYDYRGRSLTSAQALAARPYDVAVVTWFETFELAKRLAPKVVHFCQGIEADLEHLASRLPEIQALYSASLPTLIVSPHLGTRLSADYGTASVVLPPLLDSAFRPRWGRFGPASVPAILVHGIYEAAVKRVRPALEAVEILRRESEIRLVRVSNFPQSTGEAALSRSDAFLVDHPPDAVAKLTAGLDITLFTSEAGEGFGLPVLESLAAGVPVVAVRIPSLAAFEHLDAVLFVHRADPQLLASALREALEPKTWRGMRRRGLEFARLWRRGQERRAAKAFRRVLALGG